VAVECIHCGSRISAGQPVCPECGKSSDEGASVGTPGSPWDGPRPARRDKQKDFSLVGRVIAGKYSILDVLGQGGFGSVYLAEITAGMVGERVALKILPEELSSHPAFREQFLNEIRIAMRVVDRYIAQIRDVGTTEDGLLYYTMDLCPGQTLAQILRAEGRLPVPRTLLIVLNVLRGLQTAHASGVIHRDLKPANLMVETVAGKDTVRILDFGIATAIHVPGAGGSRDAVKGFAGSPHYMPPEQYLGETLGFTADIYALGVILYECITGQRPYPGSTAQEVFSSLRSRPPTAIHILAPEAASFSGLAEIVQRAMEKNPEKRFASARELFDAVSGVLARGTAALAAQRSRGPSSAPAQEPGAPRSRGAAPLAAATAAADTPAALTTSARAAASRIRRRRYAGLRRGGSHAPAVALATFIVAGTVIGVVFNKEIVRIYRNRFGTPGAPTAGVSPAAGNTDPSRAGSNGPEKRSPLEAKSLGEAKAAAKKDLAAKVESTVASIRKAIAAGQWTDAADLAATAVGLDPESAEAHLLQGTAALGLRDYKGAAEALEKSRTLAIRTGTGSTPELLIGLAEVKLHLSPPLPTEAEALAREALGKAPKDSEAVLILARALEAQGKIAEARQALESARAGGVDSPELRAIAKRLDVGSPEARRKDAEETTAEARRALVRGDAAHAAELALKAIDIAPLVEAELLAADSFVELREWRKAQGILEGMVGREASSAKNDCVTARLHRTKVVLALPQDDAVPDDEAMKAVARELLASDEAFARCGDAQALARYKLGANLALARAQATHGDWKSVRVSLAGLGGTGNLGNLVDAAKSYLILARTASTRGARSVSAAEARKLLQGALRSSSAQGALVAEAQFLLGMAQMVYGDIEKSDASYAQAVASFAAAEKAGSRTPALYESWAGAYQRMGNLIRAAQLLRSAYEVEPSVASCLRAADGYIAANPKSPEARDVLREGLQRFKDSDDIRRRLEELSGQ